MTYSYEFSGGEWKALEDDPLAPFEVQDGTRGFDWDKTIRAAGYSYYDFSLDESPSFQLRWAVDETSVTKRWPFMVEFCLGLSQSWIIFVGSLPDLFALAPAIGAFSARDGAAEYITQTMEAARERRGRR